ncbi:MAG: c-type cytochrome [Actinomycetota bacterium]
MNINRVVLTALVSVLAGLLLTAAPALGAVAADQQDGRILYENSCSTCHGVDGRGTADGPTLESSGAAGAHFMLSTGRMPLDDPTSQPVRKTAAFTEEEILRISAYVASISDGPPIPEVELEEADLAEGQQLFSANCAACHNSAGSGGAVGAGLEAPALHESTPVQVVEATRIGPGTMPVFDQSTLSDEEVNSIARYLAYLKEAPDPGGLGLGRIGPIAEGFVTWLVGVGLLVLAARWIGEKQ